MSHLHLSWIDYTLFILLFVLSGAIGIYFGCFGKQQTVVDYLLAGKKMKVFPVAMSLVASLLSGITLLGLPAEVYVFGMQCSMVIVSLACMGLIVNFVYLPVFYKLQPLNSFEYLEIRFGRTIKRIASILYLISTVMFLPLTIYAPSLAFNQVTGFNLYAIASIMCLICAFYTAIGGLKAVIWTDALQFLIILCTLGFILVMGTNAVGGLETLWERSKLGGRLEFFNMDFDPTVRNTFWSVVLGNTALWLSFGGTEPICVQRYLAVPSLRDAQITLFIFVIFQILAKFISYFFGLIMYANYFDCDPLTAGFIKKADQILPYYVLEVANSIPGLCGLFVAGIFTTALSTLSSYVNTLSGIVYKDVIEPFQQVHTSEERASTQMKIIAVVLGVMSVLLIFLIERLGTILQLMLILTAISTGPVLGIFTLGMLFPWANKKGALSGLIVSVFLVSLIIVQNQIYVWKGRIRYTRKPLDTSGCNITTSISQASLNYTTTPSDHWTSEEPFWLYRISFHYYPFLGSIVSLIIGLAISLITRNSKDEFVNPDLLSPCIHRFLKRSGVTTRSVGRELDFLEGKENRSHFQNVAKVDLDSYNLLAHNSNLL